MSEAARELLDVHDVAGGANRLLRADGGEETGQRVEHADLGWRGRGLLAHFRELCRRDAS